MAYQDMSELELGLISYADAREIMIEHHYAHKWNATFGKVNVGIFQRGNPEPLGRASFGHARNPQGWRTVGDFQPAECLELNRLWVSDELKANTESWMLARCWPILREKGYRLVQSFADGRLGVGTTYQATNFSYHGYHTSKFYRDKNTGEVFNEVQSNNTARARSMVATNLLIATGDLELFTVRTYRYLYPLDKKARKQIKLPSLPYPKERHGLHVIEGYRPPVQQMARAVHLSTVFGGHEELMDYFTRTYTDKDLNMELEKARANKHVTACLERARG